MDKRAADEQVQQGVSINKSIKSLWNGSKLTNENARLIKENAYTLRQV